MVLRSRLETLRARNRDIGHDYTISPLVSQQLGFEVSLTTSSLLFQTSNTKPSSSSLLLLLTLRLTPRYSPSYILSIYLSTHHPLPFRFNLNLQYHIIA